MSFSHGTSHIVNWSDSTDKVVSFVFGFRFYQSRKTISANRGA